MAPTMCEAQRGSEGRGVSKVGQSSPVAADLEIVPTMIWYGLWAWIRLEPAVN
jgi:hypothetical protein